MIVTVFLLFTITMIIAFAYDYYVYHTRTGRLIDKIPGLKTIPIFGNILTAQTSPGTKWHSRRKMLTPTFHFNILRQFVATLAEESEHMTQKLKNVGDTIKIDVLQYVSEHTLNAICETTMGISLRNQIFLGFDQINGIWKLINI